jgi:O-antigen ligase
MFFFTHKKYRAMIGSLAIIILILVAAIAITNPKIKSRMIDSTVTYISDYSNSANGRIVSSAFEIWSRHGNYFTGIGIRNYRSQMAHKDNEDLRKKLKMRPGNLLHTHNIYVEWLIEAGVIGFIGFSLMVCLILKEIFSTTLPQRQYLAATFAFAVLLTTFFPFMGGMSFFTNRIACIIWMTVGWSIAFTSKKSCLERHD